MGVSISNFHKMRDQLEQAGVKQPGVVPLKMETANAAPGVRIRQDSKPLLNELELQWFNYLKSFGTVTNLSAQALRFKLANGEWYKCDMVGWVFGRLTGWECKGGKKMKGYAKGISTVKRAAHEWPEVDFYLVWKDDGQWKVQRVLA